MGYKNNQLGFPKDLLISRAIIKKGNFALIPENGLVKNIIPGFEGCSITILSSPKIGATFVDYIVDMEDGGYNKLGFGGDGVETFVYVIDGAINVNTEDEKFSLTQGGYLYCPPQNKMFFENISGKNAHLFLYKRRYKQIEGHAPYTVNGSTEQVKEYCYEDMDNVFISDLLPKEIAFDMNFHILSFKPGASHGYIETHVQEHGAYVLTGQGMYNLDNNWVPVKKGDYMFMSAYSLQAAYGVGTEMFSYVYSKDCNRDEDI